MRALHVEFLENGSIPLYAVDAQVAFHLDEVREPHQWDIRAKRPESRLLVRLWENDYTVRQLPDLLRGWLAMLNEEDGSSPDGSLVFPIRHIARLPAIDDLNGPPEPIIMAGICFLPEVTYGVPLDGADPVDIIMQAIDADGVNADTLHPAAAAARQQRIEYRVRWEQQRVQDARKRALVDKRSKALMRECLSRYQWWEWNEYGYFHVLSPDGYTYRVGSISLYGTGVARIEEGEITAGYCIHPEGLVPRSDTFVAQKLLLEFEPEQFHETANYTLIDHTTDRPRQHEADTRAYNMFGDLLADIRENEPVRIEVPPELPWNMHMIADAFAEVERHGRRVARIYLPAAFRDWLEDNEDDFLIQGTLWGASLHTSQDGIIEAEAEGEAA